MVKPDGGQQCIFDVFLTNSVEVNENLGVERHRGGGLNPTTPPPPTNRALYVSGVANTKKLGSEIFFFGVEQYKLR